MVKLANRRLRISYKRMGWPNSSQKVATLLLSFRRTVSDELTTFIPIYPNRLEFVPKPSRTSRTPPSVIISLERSRGATTRLENR